MESKKSKNNKKKKNRRIREVEIDDNNNLNNEKNDNNEKKEGPVKYFLMVPLESETLMTCYKELKERLEKEKPANYDQNLFQKPQKLHMTLLVLDINENKEKTEKVINLLNNLLAEIKNITAGELSYVFDKYDVFESVKKTYVVYGKMLEDENNYKLKIITDLIIKKLLEENIINKNDFKDLKINEEYSDNNLIYTIKFHLTLLNVKYLNRVLQNNKQKTIHNFDSTEILFCIKDIKLPECQINKINLCAMREDENTGKYEIIHSFDIR